MMMGIYDIGQHVDLLRTELVGRLEDGPDCIS
jgi:hypothetical protein